MGCNPLGNSMSKVLRKLCAKVKRRRALKAHQPIPEEMLAKSVIPGNDNPIKIKHPPPEATRTWDPLPTSAPSSSTHVFPATSETEEIVRVHFAVRDPHDLAPTDPYGDRNDTEWTRDEPGFTCVGSISPASARGTEDEKRDHYCGEYHCYPTPVREGICSLATDSNRLTTIFSDENPNACNII